MLYRFRVEDGLSEAFTAEDAAVAFSSVNRKSLERLRVGETYTDQSGDVWIAEVSAEDAAARDERLERVAVAAMVAWIPFTDLLYSRGLTPAQAAMNDARGLIAELDKQA